jgi:hypothetical protein
MYSQDIKAPTFFLTYWRPWEEKANFVDSFLNYAKDTSISKYTSDSIGKFIQNSSFENVSAIKNLGREIGLGYDYLGDAIKKTSEDQIFELKKTRREISFGLSNISNELFSIGLKVDLLIARIDASNILLRDITKLLRVPESEKERQRCIELGLKFFISADKDEDLFEDALNEFLKAEKLMPQDFFTLYYIGLIYLISPNHINVEIANSYFSKSGKYGFIECSNDGIIYENVLDRDSSGDNKGISTNNELIRKTTSSAYEKTAYSFYILGDYVNALKFQKKALEIEESSKNFFFLTKYQIRNSLISESCESITKCLDLDPKSILSIFLDLDLITSNEILEIVKEKNIILNKQIDVLIDEFSTINYLNSNEQIVILKESKEIRFDKKLDAYISSQKRKQEILEFIEKEKEEKKKLNDLEIENQRQIEQLNDFIKLKLSFYLEFIFNQLYVRKMRIESDLIEDKVLEALNKENFGSFWRFSECLNAKERASSFFSSLFNFFKIESDKEFKLFLSEEFKIFNSNEENLKLMNHEFDLKKYIDLYKELSEKKDEWRVDDYYMRTVIEELLLKKAPNINKILNVSQGLLFYINSIKFKDDFNNRKKDNFYMDSTTRNYYIKYMDLALSVYKKKLRSMLNK